MADPEFVPKVWQIQEYWRSAALAAISRQAEPGPRHDRLAAWPAGPQPTGERGRSPCRTSAPPRASEAAGNLQRRHVRAGGHRRRRGPDSWPLGNGTGNPGRPRTRHCRDVHGPIPGMPRTRTWVGTFSSAGGWALRDLAYYDQPPPGTHAGSVIPALYPGGSNEVFAPHGSHSWLQILVTMIFTAGLLAVGLWAGPIRYLRRRRQATRSRATHRCP
jgi:hypothetical protein